MSTEELFSVLWKVWFARQFDFYSNQEVFQLLIVSQILTEAVNPFYASRHSSK